MEVIHVADIMIAKTLRDCLNSRTLSVRVTEGTTAGYSCCYMGCDANSINISTSCPQYILDLILKNATLQINQSVMDESPARHEFEGSGFKYGKKIAVARTSAMRNKADPEDIISGMSTRKFRCTRARVQ
jgi:hypothetical protein